MLCLARKSATRSIGLVGRGVKRCSATIVMTLFSLLDVYRTEQASSKAESRTSAGQRLSYYVQRVKHPPAVSTLGSFDGDRLRRSTYRYPSMPLQAGP